MYLKIVPRNSNGNGVHTIECKRYLVRYVQDMEITDDVIISFDVHVGEGEDELEFDAVILRLDWGSEQAVDVLISRPANVYVMSDNGQTVDRFGVA